MVEAVTASETSVSFCQSTWHDIPGDKPSSFPRCDFIALMMEAARTSETSVDIQLRTRRYIPEYSELHFLASFFFRSLVPDLHPLLAVRNCSFSVFTDAFAFGRNLRTLSADTTVNIPDPCDIPPPLELYVTADKTETGHRSLAHYTYPKV
jgi:hypothetical protein